MITQEELQAIRERCDNAVPGKWDCYPSADLREDYPEYVGGWFVAANNGRAVICDMVLDGNNAETSSFIAHSRQDIPALLAEVERLQAKISELEYDIAVMRGEINDFEGEE